jgi:hypothetical protein
MGFDRSMRILVTGPRQWEDTRLVSSALTDAHNFCRYELGLSGRPTLVYGGATGLDYLSLREAINRGWLFECHPARWYDGHGDFDRTAGFKRNQIMVDSKIDVWCVFLMRCFKKECTDKPKPHFTHGTSDCLRRLEKSASHIPIRKYYA